MLFKILHGDDAYISLDIVPFHEGYCYVTYGGNMYVDMNTGTASEPNNQRIQLNAANAQTLCDMTLEEIKAELSSQPDWNDIKNKPFGEENTSTEVANGSFTTIPIPDFGGAYGALINFDGETYSMPKTVTLVLDGVEYSNLPIMETAIGFVVGNASKINMLAGTSYPDTGEPFVLGVGVNMGILATDMVSLKSYDVVLTYNYEITTQIDEKYIPNPVICTMSIEEADTTITLGGTQKVDCGDGTVDTNNEHTYTTPGEYICKVYVGNSLTKSLFGHCNELTKVKIPNGITNIEALAFDNCRGLTSVEIPDTVVSIGREAFEYCSELKSVEFGCYVTNIEDYAFEGCSNLTSVTFKNPTPITYSSMWFTNCDNLNRFIVPHDSLELYVAAWTEVVNKIDAVALLSDVGNGSGSVTENRVNELIDAAINGALGGNY